MTRHTLLVHTWIQTALWIAIAAVGTHLGAAVHARVDVTHDQRFSLSETAYQSVSSLDRPLVARVVFTRDLDPPYHNHATALVDLLTELQAHADGRLEIQHLDPTGDPEAVAHAGRLGIRPVTYTRQDWDRREARQVFMGVSFAYGAQTRVVEALPSIERMEYEIVRAIRAVTTPPEDRKTIGWLQGNGEPNLQAFPNDTPLGQLRDDLARSHDLVPIALTDGPVPEAVDALLVVGPQLAVSAEDQRALDQFVMRGGAIGWFLSGFQPDFRRMEARAVRHDLHGLLGHYGVTLGRDLLLDRTHLETLVVPVDGHLVRVSHPLAVTTTRLDRVHGPVRDLKQVTLPFATALSVVPDQTGREAHVWVTSMPSSVTTPGRSLHPSDLAQVAAGEARGPFPVVVALSGRFPSYFVARQPDLIPESTPTRMVIAASADLVANNAALVENAVDWLVEDSALASIRSRAIGDDPLQAPEAHDAWRWKIAIAAPPLLLVWALGALVGLRSRR